MSNPSTSTGFDLTRSSIVDLALADVSAIGPGKTADARLRAHANRVLSMVQSELSVLGILRWRFERRNLTLTAGTGVYTLDSDVWDVEEPINYRISSSDFSRRPLWALSMEDYRLLSNRELQTDPAQYVIEKTLGANGEVAQLTLYPYPNITGAIIEYAAILKLRDPSTDANTMDIPAKWLNCLRWKLALNLSPAYKVPAERVAFFTSQFEAAKQDCLADDHERVNLVVAPFASSNNYSNGGWYS